MKYASLVKLERMLDTHRLVGVVALSPRRLIIANATVIRCTLYWVWLRYYSMVKRREFVGRFYGLPSAARVEAWAKNKSQSICEWFRCVKSIAGLDRDAITLKPAKAYDEVKDVPQLYTTQPNT